MIHLDTSFLIRALARGLPEDRRLRGWLRSQEPLGMSSISWAEFLCGPVGAETCSWLADSSRTRSRSSLPTLR